MMKRPFKIGVAGTHSTGKSTLVSLVRRAFEREGLRVGQVEDLATRARDLGFPILMHHTYESTLWIMAECMRQEAELALSSDVIIVDRPVPDALGYLWAALDLSGRSEDPRRLQELEAIAVAHVGDYDLLVLTVLDISLPLGPGRDSGTMFRQAAADKVSGIMDRYAPKAIKMTSKNSTGVAEALVRACLEARH
ncbi:AAA family ATPase [Roseinatronobacter monicus]|uniref:AAA domain-containing protein n=1 Tax=Roseinatronobacter monicus TaxID=393481 RepID=A0A543K4C8_9RHOB|nr:AAA family ATPase [Roseinatronobacter monicus]TQM89938.1 AAA domain-containing protein [Roseinatronobacter monicus]